MAFGIVHVLRPLMKYFTPWFSSCGPPFFLFLLFIVIHSHHRCSHWLLWFCFWMKRAIVKIALSRPVKTQFQNLNGGILNSREKEREWLWRKDFYFEIFFCWFSLSSSPLPSCFYFLLEWIPSEKNYPSPTHPFFLFDADIWGRIYAVVNFFYSYSDEHFLIKSWLSLSLLLKCPLKTYVIGRVRIIWYVWY